MNLRLQKQYIFTALLSTLIFGHFTPIQAQEIQDMFTYQSNGSALEKSFIQSNVEGLFEGYKVQKKVSDQFALDMTQLKSAHKQFNWNQQDTLEDSTRIDLQYANQFFSRIQLGSTRQDVYEYNFEKNSEYGHQRTYEFSQGWRQNLANDLKVESYLGVVQCSDEETSNQKYYPVFGMKLRKTFVSDSEISLSAAQEVQSGGSYTGIYGNQIFRKFMAMGKIPMLKRLSFMWDLGYGFSQSSFEEKGFSLDASLVTVSAAVEYSFNDKIKGSVGYSQRSMFQMDQNEFASSGPLVSASLSVASF